MIAQKSKETRVGIKDGNGISLVLPTANIIVNTKIKHVAITETTQNDIKLWGK